MAVRDNWYPIMEAIAREHEKLSGPVYWIQWTGAPSLNGLPFVPMAKPANLANLNPSWWWR